MVLALEWPLPFLKGTALYRSYAVRMVAYAVLSFTNCGWAACLGGLYKRLTSCSCLHPAVLVYQSVDPGVSPQASLAGFRT